MWGQYIQNRGGGGQNGDLELGINSSMTEDALSTLGARKGGVVADFAAGVLPAPRPPPRARINESH
eukprot:2726670-Prymnesium_polylepis.1